MNKQEQIREYHDINGRVRFLETYINWSPNFKKLSNELQDLTKKQLEHMAEYRDVLSKRIKIEFNVDTKELW
jgi:hypothetical protein